MSSFWKFLQQPFAQPLDALHLFGVVGMVLIFAVGWNIILRRYIFEE